MTQEKFIELVRARLNLPEEELWAKAYRLFIKGYLGGGDLSEVLYE